MFGWHSKSRATLAFLAGVALCLGSERVAAQSAQPVSGVLTATARGDLPAGAAIAVKPPDGSSESLFLRDMIAEELIGRGYAVRPDAPLVFAFTVVRGPTAKPADDSRLSVTGDIGNVPSTADVAVQLDIIVLGRDTGTKKPASRRMIAVLADRWDDRIWEAELVPNSDAPDSTEAFSAMIPALIGYLGQTVYARRVP